MVGVEDGVLAEQYAVSSTAFSSHNFFIYNTDG